MNADIFKAAHKMRIDGDQFESYLAEAYFSADQINKEKLVFNFGQLFDKYLNRPMLVIVETK